MRFFALNTHDKRVGRGIIGAQEQGSIFAACQFTERKTRLADAQCASTQRILLVKRFVGGDDVTRDLQYNAFRDSVGENKGLFGKLAWTS